MQWSPIDSIDNGPKDSLRAVASIRQDWLVLLLQRETDQAG